MIRRAGLPLALAALASCSMLGERAGGLIDAGREQAARHAEQAARALATGPVTWSDSPFLGRRVLSASASRRLPRAFECADCFVAHLGTPHDLPGIARLVERQTGMAVALGRPAAAAGPQAYWQPRYVGPLSGFLDALAARFDVAWSVGRGRRITIERTPTRVYRLEAAASASTVNATVSGAVVHQDQIADQTVSAQFQVDAWREIEQIVRGAAPEPARVSLSPASGTLTVTGPPSVHRRVAALVGELDAILSPQVTARVSLFLIDVSDGSDFGLDLGAALAGSRGDFAGGIGFRGLAPEIIEQAGAVAGSVIGPDASAGRSWTGSLSAVARAVAASGRLVDSHHAVVSSRSSTVTPVALTTRTNYVRELKVTTDSGVTSYSTEVETLVTGYALQVLPRVDRTGRVSIHLSVSTSDLLGLTTSSFGQTGAFLQLPRVAQRVFTLDSSMESGEALVLAGYDQERTSLQDTGMGDAGFLGLGGSRRAEVRRVRLIIAVEPRVRARPRPTAPSPVLITGVAP